MVEVKKKDGESFESLLRRFNRKIQQSGVLVRARKTRFFEAPKSKKFVRDDARRRAVNKEKRERPQAPGQAARQDVRRQALGTPVRSRERQQKIKHAERKN